MTWKLKELFSKLLYRFARWCWPFEVQTMADGKIGFAGVVVYRGNILLFVDVGGTAMTPDEALEFADLLIEASEIAEDNVTLWLKRARNETV